jgi:hypothetical protein
MSDELDFYATPGVMTSLDGFDTALDGLPTDPNGIAAAVQGLVLHLFWATSYGVDVPIGREHEVRTRSATRMIETMLRLDPRPLVEPRPPAQRFLGNCRHFSTFTVALLRRAGIPSRARCGFGNYFEQGKWIDHWIVEHWDGERWVELDAQIDDLQRNALGLEADPTDFAPGEHFLPAGHAWQRCQAGLEDGDRFGILDMWGQWFIKGNIARDLASLNKVEMLPWDGWGELASETPTSGPAFVDEIAALTFSGDHDAVRARYETDDRLRVPPKVVCFDAPTPYEDLVPELL